MPLKTIFNHVLDYKPPVLDILDFIGEMTGRIEPMESDCPARLAQAHLREAFIEHPLSLTSLWAILQTLFLARPGRLGVTPEFIF